MFSFWRISHEICLQVSFHRKHSFFFVNNFYQFSKHSCWESFECLLATCSCHLKIISMVFKNFSRLVPCYISHPLISYLPFNPSEFWHHISKPLHYFLCSSLVRDSYLAHILLPFSIKGFCHYWFLKPRVNLVFKFHSLLLKSGILEYIISWVLFVKIYILILCSFIFKYVPVKNNGHLLAEKNSLARGLTLYLCISGCRSCLEASSCQKCPWLSAFFPKSSLLEAQADTGADATGIVCS